MGGDLQLLGIVDPDGHTALRILVRDNTMIVRQALVCPVSAESVSSGL
jgi:hypothetical protein